MSMTNSNDTIGIRTRDLAACRAGPQPTAPPSAPLKTVQCAITGALVQYSNRGARYVTWSHCVRGLFPLEKEFIVCHVPLGTLTATSRYL